MYVMPVSVYCAAGFCARRSTLLYNFVLHICFFFLHALSLYLSSSTMLLSQTLLHIIIYDQTYVHAFMTGEETNPKTGMMRTKTNERNIYISFGEI